MQIYPCTLQLESFLHPWNKSRVRMPNKWEAEETIIVNDILHFTGSSIKDLPFCCHHSDMLKANSNPIIINHEQGKLYRSGKILKSISLLWKVGYSCAYHINKFTIYFSIMAKLELLHVASYTIRTYIVYLNNWLYTIYIYIYVHIYTCCVLNTLIAPITKFYILFLSCT